MQKTYDQCAEECLDTWLTKEAAFVSDLESVERPRRLDAIKRAAGHFKIARTMPRKFDLQCRYEPVLKLIDDPKLRRLTEANLIDTVQLLRKRLGAAYGKADLLSPATKFLWLIRRDVAIIYDRQARVALGTPAGDYRRFVECWRSRYALQHREIRSACRRVGEARAEVDSRAGRSGRALTLELWFSMRVLDIQLWYEGTPSQARDALSAADAARPSR